MFFSSISDTLIMFQILRKNHHIMSKFNGRVIILGEDSVLYLCVSCLHKLT